MHLSEAKIDIDGNAIGPGEISANANARLGFEIPPHKNLSLEFERWIGRESRLVLWPLENVEQGPDGFCVGKKGAVGFAFRDLLQSDIDRGRGFFRDVDLLERAGTDCGEVVGETPFPPIQLMESFRVRRSFDVAGMLLEFSIRLAPVDGDVKMTASLSWDPEDIQIHARLSWATIALLGFQVASLLHKYETSDRGRPGILLADLPAPGSRLSDLRIDRLNRPCVVGAIDFSHEGETLPPNRESNRILSVNLETGLGQLTFSGFPEVRIDPQGFLQTGIASKWVGLRIFDSERLEAVFRSNDQYELSARGDQLGVIARRVPQMDVREFFSSARQEITSLRLGVSRRDAYLEFEGVGDVGGLEPGFIAALRREGLPVPDPVDRFHLSAKIPIALFLVRGFWFAKARAQARRAIAAAPPLTPNSAP